MDWTEQLNERQLQAVRYGDGPLLVLAGAGSGKTRVITHRIAWLIAEKGVEPEEIVALTFTNKAASEMEERVVELLGDIGLSVEQAQLNISTFHSFGARLLRENAESAGLDWYFDIYDRDDQIALLRQVLEQRGEPSGKSEAKAALGYIQDMKNQGKGPRRAQEEAFSDDEEKDAFIYEAYQEALREANSADFGDLLLQVLKCFRETEALARHYSRRWSHLLVDEFQDTNPAQYQLLEYLTSKHDNLTVVGDDDQSIYQWRGATVRNILDFEADFPDAESVSLERNYRSTGHILEAANDVIAENENRREKRLWTEKSQGDELTYYTAGDGAEEATYIARRISKLRRRDEPDIGVIYRTNAQGRRLEEALRKRSIPYLVRGGTSFYERAEIKDVLAYLRVIANPANDIAWERIVNRPKRGIGSVTQSKLSDATDIEGIESFWDAILHVTDSEGVLFGEGPQIDRSRLDEGDLNILDELDGITGRPAGGISDFREQIERFHRQLQGSKPLSDILQSHLNRIGYFEYIDKQYKESATDRRGNVFELLTAIDDFEASFDESDYELPDDESISLGIKLINGFLQEATLTRDTEAANQEAPVVLMTAHGAKGLEFGTVFVAGAEDRYFPHRRGSDRTELDRDKIAEERRLMYVALTRAKEQLYVTNAKRRRVYGKTRKTGPSRFVLDIGRDHIQIDPESRAAEIEYGRSYQSSSTASDFDWSPESRSERESTFEHGVSEFPSYEPEPIEESNEDESSGDKEGHELIDTTVSHSKFGVGTVKSVDGEGEEALLRIHFPTSGEKTIVRRFVKIYG